MRDRHKLLFIGLAILAVLACAIFVDTCHARTPRTVAQIVHVTPVPEPWAFPVLGMCVLACIIWRKK